MNRLTKIFILLSAFLSIGYSANVQVSSSLDARQIMVQESFTWRIEVSGSEEMPQVNLPDIDKVALLSGPMQSSNYSYINGNVTSKKTLSYTFVALEAGKIIMPAVEVFLGREKYMTESTSLMAIASRNTPTKKKSAKEDPVFIRSIPNKTSVYVGEPVSIRYKLFTKVGVYNYQVDKLPDAVGFWAEEIVQSSQPRLVSEVVNGVRYNTAILKTVLYYPTRSGDLMIDPLRTELEIEVKSNQRNRKLFNDPFFNDPFFSGTRKATKNFLSNPVKIKVKSLPEPRPKNFSGAVGRFQVKATLDTNAVLVNDAVGLNIVLSGYGNFESLKLPDLKTPEGVDRFKPERSESVKIKNMRHQGSKKLTYLLVPRKAGKLVIDPIEFTYFDLGAKKYITNSSGFIKLNVYSPDGNQPLITSGYSREEVALMREDIRFIKAVDDRFSYKNSSPFTMGFWSIHILGIFGVLGLYGYQYRSRQLEGNVDLRRSVGAMREAKRKLSQAQQLSDDSPALRSLLHQIIAGYIGAKLNVPENAMDTTELVGLLRKKKIAGEIVAETRHFLEGLTMDRFAPGAVQKEANEWVEQTQKLLQDLRKVL